MKTIACKSPFSKHSPVSANEAASSFARVNNALMKATIRPSGAAVLGELAESSEIDGRRGDPEKWMTGGPESPAPRPCTGACTQKW